MHPAGGMQQSQQGALSGGDGYDNNAAYAQQQQQQYPQQQQAGGYAAGGGLPVSGQEIPQQQQQQYQQPQGYANGNAGNDMNAFFGEVGLLFFTFAKSDDLSQMTHFLQIDNISSELTVLKRNIDRIGNLHSTVLNSTVNEQRQEQAQSELNQLTQDTSRLTNNLKLRIKNLSEQNDKIPNVPGNESDKNTRRMQVAAQKKKCVCACVVFMSCAFDR